MTDRTRLRGDNAQAMTRENVEVVRAIQPAGSLDLVELFRAGPSAGVGPEGIDVAAISSDADIQFMALESGPLQDRQLIGVEGLIEGWRDWLEPWQSYVMESEDVIDAGEQVVSLIRVRAKTSHDGVEVEHSPAAVWTVEDRMVVAVTFYLDRDQALEAAGLSE